MLEPKTSFSYARRRGIENLKIMLIVSWKFSYVHIHTQLENTLIIARICDIGNLILLWLILWLCLQVWFQNRRAKWKKRKKTTNVFRSPGALLPSHGLPPFGSMSDGLCSSGMFGTTDSRWGVTGMTPGEYLSWVWGDRRNKQLEYKLISYKFTYIVF